MEPMKLYEVHQVLRNPDNPEEVDNIVLQEFTTRDLAIAFANGYILAYRYEYDELSPSREHMMMPWDDQFVKCSQPAPIDPRRTSEDPGDWYLYIEIQKLPGWDI